MQRAYVFKLRIDAIRTRSAKSVPNSILLAV